MLSSTKPFPCSCCCWWWWFLVVELIPWSFISFSLAACNTDQDRPLMAQLIDLLNIHAKEVQDVELEIRFINFNDLTGNQWTHDTLNDTTRVPISIQSYTVNYTRPRQSQPTHKVKSESMTNRTEIVLLLLENSSDFYAALGQIVEEDQLDSTQWSEHDYDYHRNWRPKYFLIYPEQIPEESSVNHFFNDTNFGQFVKNISMDEDIYIVLQQGQNSQNQIHGNLSIWELYSIAEVHFYKKVQLSTNCQIDWLYLNNKFRRRKNFERATIKATAPFNYLYDAEVSFVSTLPNGDAVFRDGSSVSLIRYLGQGLNFTEHAMVETVTFEKEDTVDVQRGPTIEIINGKADISIEQKTMTRRRQNQIRFLHATYFDGADAFFVQPPVSTARNLYLAPFKLDLWLVMLGSWLLLIIGMKACAWIKSLRAEIAYEDQDVLKDVYLWAVGAICQQGWHTQPVSVSLRIIFIVGYLCGLLCFVAFSAAIVSLLSVKVVPIQSMDDIIKNSFHLLACPNNSLIEGLSYLIDKQSGYPTGTIVSEKEAIGQITKSKTAMLTYPDVFYNELQTAFASPMAEKDVCGTYSWVPVSSTPFRAGMVVNHKSPFVEFFNCQILLMRERGLNIRYIFNYYEETQVTCLITSTGFKQALGILDVMSAFYILSAGHILSCAILGIEITSGKSVFATVHTVRQ